MDDMTSLGSNLPARRQRLKDLDSELVSEFKSAACAVTQLFKLSGARTTVAKEEGYLEAIQDLLTALNDTNGKLDVVAWALDKKKKLSGGEAEDEEETGEEEEEEEGRDTSVRPFTFSAAQFAKKEKDEQDEAFDLRLNESVGSKRSKHWLLDSSHKRQRH